MAIRFFYRIGLLIFFCTTPLRAAFEPFSWDARSLALGDAVACCFFNPTALSVSPKDPGPLKPGIVVSLSQPYGLKDLTRASMTGLIPTPIGTAGLGVSTFGNKLYRENTLELGLTRKLIPGFHAGLLMRTLWLEIQDYGSSLCVSLDAGLSLNLSPRLLFCCAATNVLRQRQGEQFLPLPQIFRMGLSYRPSQNWLLLFEFDKDLRYPGTMRGGLEWFPRKELSLRCGFTQFPDTFSCGMGLKLPAGRLDYAWQIHAVLGATHKLSLVFGL